MGISAPAAFDLNTACSGFSYALGTADHAISAGAARNALVIGAEKLSDVTDWTERQLTTGRDVTIVDPDGTSRTDRALGVDAASGGLVIEDGAAPGGERTLVVGEVRHVRLVPPRVGV